MFEKLLLPPSEDTLGVIRRELNEDPDRFANGVKLFERWVECQNHLPKNYEKNMLHVYLRGCKHDMEKAKRKLENLFFARQKLIPLFPNHAELGTFLESTMKASYIIPLPRLTSDGQRVTMFKFKSVGVENFNMKAFMKLTIMLGELRTCKEYPNSGDVYIFDAKNFELAYVALFLDTLLKKFLFIGQDAFPFRIKKVLLVNAPQYVEKMVTVIKTMLSDKLAKRIFTVKNLTEHIDVSVLPEDYGGEERSLEKLSEEWLIYLKENSEFFKRLESQAMIGKVPKNLECHCDPDDSVNGSFRTLNID